jgi:nucleolar GTP-binding protein
LTMARKREVYRIRTAGQTCINKLTQTVKEFPQLDELHLFYSELADVIVGVGDLKKSLGALNWAANMIKRLTDQSVRRVKRVRETEEAARIRRRAYGRIASIISRVENDLVFLKESSNKLRRLPSIATDTITIVVAGYANVGKSTFVKQVSTAKPEINTYPFTTKGIILGHRKTPSGLCQIVDTPGLLDRPLHERNQIERQAILALKHLAYTIVFMFDPSETCGYSFTHQLNLYNELKKEFTHIPFIKVLNKVDLADSATIERARKLLGDNSFETVAKDGLGVQEVFKEALILVNARDVV